MPSRAAGVCEVSAITSAAAGRRPPAERELFVQGGLADRLRGATASGGPGEQIADRLVQILVGDGPVDQAPVEGLIGRDHVAGEGEFGRALAADIAGDGHHRRVAEPPALAARGGEPGRLGRHGEVARRDELAACGRRQSVHPRDHRLRDRLDQVHQPPAGIEQLAYRGQVGRGDVGEVVPGAEDGASAGQDDARRVAVADGAERGDEVARWAADSALRRCGRFIVIVANSPSNSTSTFSRIGGEMLAAAQFMPPLSRARSARTMGGLLAPAGPVRRAVIAPGRLAAGGRGLVDRRRRRAQQELCVAGRGLVAEAEPAREPEFGRQLDRVVHLPNRADQPPEQVVCVHVSIFCAIRPGGEVAVTPYLI